MSSSGRTVGPETSRMRVQVAAQQSPAEALAVLGPHDQAQRVVRENLLEQRIQEHAEREEIRVRVARRTGSPARRVPRSPASPCGHPGTPWRPGWSSRSAIRGRGSRPCGARCTCGPRSTCWRGCTAGRSEARDRPSVRGRVGRFHPTRGCHQRGSGNSPPGGGVVDRDGLDRAHRPERAVREHAGRAGQERAVAAGRCRVAVHGVRGDLVHAAPPAGLRGRGVPRAAGYRFHRGEDPGGAAT